MKFIKKLSAVVLSCAMSVTCLNSIVTFKTDAAVVISVSPFDKYEVNNGIFEGWGTSLCWWANRTGYSDSLAQQTADLFYGENGLRMNIARFNIGGGDDPTHRHITRTDSNMPGYTVINNGNVTYDWNADYNQRNVLKRAIAAAGDDMIVEMFSNSPPYYMTKSGCSSGGTDGGKNNLKDDHYDDFAEYLAEVTAHYEKEWGIDVQSITAMNEPYTNFWYANSPKQEGCHFDQGESESKIILELQKSLEKRGLNDIIISGCDETSIDTQISSFNKLSADAKNAIGRIDTHTYSGSNRTGLKDTAIAAGKNLWMSEVDGGSTAGTNAGEMGAALWLADRITADCNGLNCSAWILWQAIDNHISSVGYNGNKDKGMVDVNKGYWGLAVADHDKDTVILTKKYYAFGQYSRYIRPGMTMLKASDSTMAAFDEKNGQLVLVSYNTSGSEKEMNYDLSEFTSVGNSAQIIRTSNTENWKDAGKAEITNSMLKTKLPANSVSTFIIEDVKGSSVPENPIDLSKAVLSGSNSWKNDVSTDYTKAFDGKSSTYFDGLGEGWVQADLGQSYDISAIGYIPRTGYEYRMADAMFMFSEDGINWNKAYTVMGKPSSGIHYVTKFASSNTARYVKFQTPAGTPNNGINKDNSYCCNIAEIQIYGVPSVKERFTKIVPKSISGSESWKQNEATSYEKAFDGDTATYFDGLKNGYVQVDLGGSHKIQAVGYSPRKGYEYRMPDCMIQVSSDGASWETVYTFSQKPSFGMNYITDLGSDVTARYVRCIVPEGKPSNGYNSDDVYNFNIAEFEVYGEPSEVVKYDVNMDGVFSVADAVLLQKWLLAVPDTRLDDWKAADLCEDGIIDVYDLCLMKKELQKAN
ncbi:MAG: discoidin domain-containing protein [Ruminococcus sp.]|nr:discoidin domain-containing protein [Ruminococcus sp.]